MYTIKKSMCGCIAALLYVLVLPAHANAASLEDLESRMERLEALFLEEKRGHEQAREELKQTKKELQKTQEELKMVAKTTKETASKVKKAPPEKDDDVNVALYGRLWPRLTFRTADNSSTDITDALSRVGIAASAKVNDDLTAVMKGEWDVDIENNGNFGDARQAYVGLDSNTYGFVAIGKQWDPHFNIVAGVTDIFYHRSSPFGYDEVGPFRTNNLVRYANSWGGLKIDLGAQVNGDAGGSNGGGNAAAGTSPDNIDAASIGAGYNIGSAYLGVSVLRQNTDGDLDLERIFYGLAGSYKPFDDLYLAFTYQYITAETETDKLDQYSLDLAASYSFGQGYNLSFGFFAFDDDTNTTTSRELFGQNVTLIKTLNESSKVFFEWLRRDFENRTSDDEENTFSIGFRYDFNVDLY